MINIEQCYATGIVQGTSNVGGLIGYLYNARVLNSYATGGIEETLGWRKSLYGREYMFMYFGGLIGTSGAGQIINCYSAGQVAGAPYASYSQVEYHGLIGPDVYGYSENDVTYSYFDIDKANRSDDYATSKNTSQMKQQSTFNGWDFTDVWGIDNGINDGYPYLLFFESPPPLKGINIFVITDMGLKQVSEVSFITDNGLKSVSENITI